MNMELGFLYFVTGKLPVFTFQTLTYLNFTSLHLPYVDF